MTDPRFSFLICSERSGSNLLTSLLNAHGQVSAPPPSHLFRLFASNTANYGSLARDENWDVLIGDTANAFAAQLGSWNTFVEARDLHKLDLPRHPLAPVMALYQHEATHDGATHIFVKENHTARFAETLCQHMGDLRFVFMTRDPRDVAASYLASDGIPGGVLTAVERWEADQGETQALRQDPVWAGRIHFLRYEDLIADNEPTLRAICAHLDLPFDPAMGAFHQHPRTQRNAKRIEMWKNLARPVMAGNAGKYRAALTREEITFIELRCGALMRAFGYAPDIVTDLPDDATTRAGSLLPYLRDGAYRLQNEEEAAIRERRLAAIGQVLARRLP